MFTKNILPILVFVVAIASVFVYVYPKYTDLADLHEQDAQFATALDTANQVADLSDNISSTIKSISPANLTTLDTLLPAQIDTLKLGNDILNISTASGVKIDQITFGSGNDASGATASDTATPGINKTSITISFSTSYNQFKTFLSNLEGSLEVFDVHSIAVTPDAKEPYKYQITLDTYSLAPSSSATTGP